MANTKTSTIKKATTVVATQAISAKRPVGRPKVRVVNPVNNVTDLRNSLMQLYNDVQLGNIDHNTAKVIGNISGKIISCINAEMKLRRFNDERTKIAV